MYTDDNSNNDKDGEEKKNIPLMIKKQWASKPSTSPKEKLELGKVLKVEIGEIRAIAALVFDFFFFAFQLTFLIAKRCHCSRKSTTNHFDNSLRPFFFTVFLEIHKY